MDLKAFVLAGIRKNTDINILDFRGLHFGKDYNFLCSISVRP